MRRLPLGSVLPLTLSFLLFGLIALAPESSSAQGISTGSKSLDLAAFGGYVNINPDHGGTRNTGFTLGADATRYLHWPIAPSLEVRANYANGAIVDEKSYLGGIRAQVDVLHRIHPYADFLFGYGTIHYYVPPAPGYTDDNSAVESYGAGIDIDLLSNFQGRLDYQSQHWAFDAHNTISPTAVTVAVRYVFPFRPYTNLR